MLDLFDELRSLVARLHNGNVDYALCGGLAMAVYGAPRSTVDIDLLVPGEALEHALRIGRELGYTIEAGPMIFAGGAIRMRRLTKIDPDSADPLMLDFLIVTPEIQDVWEDCIEVEWEGGRLHVVSRDGLVALKDLRSSGQDLDDITRLRRDSDEG